MLYQDTLTGMLHEVPDSQVHGWGLAEDPYGVGEAQMVYDGLGNPLGWGFLKKLVKKAVPFATSMLGPYGQIIKHALPVVSKALADRSPPQMEGIPVAYPQPGAVSPMAMRPPFPRLDGRGRNNHTRDPSLADSTCAVQVWRGPSGLVPVNAAQGPVATPPGAAIVPVPAAVGRRPPMRQRQRSSPLTEAPRTA